MKKSTLLPCLLFAFGLANVNAQESKEYLRSVQSLRSLDEFEEYYYDSQDRLDSISISLPVNETDVTTACRKLYRDENGNVILNQWYQIIDFVFNNTAKIEYKYDENGNLIERINYQNYGTMTKAGHMKYYYNEDNLLTKKELIDVWTEDDILEYSEYEYDDNNRLLSETITSTGSGFGEKPGVKQKLLYSYNEDGFLERVQTQIVNAVGSLYESQKTEYSYDEAGNLVEVNDFLNKGVYQPAGRVKYVYDMEVSADNVVYPFDDIDPLDPAEMLYSDVKSYCNNKLVTDSVWLEFENTWGLADIREYVYDTDPGTSSIKETVSNETSELVVVNDGGLIYLPGVKDGELVYIYDVNGNLLVVSSYDQSGIATSGLPNGVKLVKVGNREAKFL